jgi:nitroreductase
MSEVRQNPVDHPVPDVVRRRWSPVAFVPEPLDDATLAAVFEGARWAASSFNEQPWRFVVGRRQEPEAFSAILGCLADANKNWAQHVSALAIVCAHREYARNGKPNAHAWFDTGQSLAQLMLTAVEQGLYAHAMGGFSVERARRVLAISEDVDPICALAIGRLADGALLDADTAARDRSPRVRRPLSETVFEGRYGDAADFVS